MSITDIKKTKAPNLGTTYFRLECLERRLHIAIRCRDKTYNSEIIRQEIISNYDIDWEERSKIVKQAEELAEKLWDVKLSASAALEPYVPHNMRCHFENDAAEKLDECLVEIRDTKESIAARYESW
tara:strand:- start:2271 stop:2648 length:378 start_codon:yes stop_codon:yes gene_type:complete